MIFVLNCPPLPPTSLFPPESVHANYPLQTDSGFHYVNSFPIKTLSKQIFREQQKEEVVSGLKRGKPFCLKAASAEHLGGGRRFGKGVALQSIGSGFIFFFFLLDTHIQHECLHCSLSARWPLWAHNAVWFFFFPSWALIRCTFARVFATISI